MTSIALILLQHMPPILMGYRTAVFVRVPFGTGVVLALGGLSLETPLWKSYFTNLFVILIWILFFIAVYGSLKYLRWLRHQQRVFEQVKTNLAGVIEAHENDVILVRLRILDNLPAESILAERIEDLYWLSERGSEFDQATSAETLATRENGRTGFARSVASVLVLLGLCGAIYGLSNLVIQMGPELRNMQELSRDNVGKPSNSGTSATPQGPSLDSIQRSVNTLIETMANSLDQTRGAFAASLTGISCSIGLLFLNWFVGKNQVRVLTEVEGLTSAKLIPLFRPLSDALELSGAANSLGVAAEYAASLTSGLDNLTGQAVESLQMVFAIVRKFEEGATAIGESQESMVQAQLQFLTLAEQFSVLTGEIAQHQASSKADVSSLVTAVNSTNEYVKRVLDESRKKHEQLLQQLEAVSKQSIFSSVETKKETHSLLAQDINQFRATVREAFDRQQKANQDQLLQMLKEQKEYVNDLQTAVTNGQGYKEFMEDLGPILAEERKSFAAQFKEAIEPQQVSLSQQLEVVVKRQEELVDRLEELSAKLTAPTENAEINDIMQQSTIQSLANQQRETNDAVRRLPAQFDRLISGLVICGKGSAVAGCLFGSVEAWRILNWPGAAGITFALLVGLVFFLNRLSSVHEGSR